MGYGWFVCFQSGFRFTLVLCLTEGRTGVPFVDANMREMAATGFMSNRGRQVHDTPAKHN